MHPRDEHILVVRAVEDADVPLRRDLPMHPPEKVMRQFKRSGRLERRHPAALWVHARHHMLDRAVLAAGIHALENNEQRPARIGIESFLEPAESRDALGRGCFGLRFSFFFLRVVAGVVGIELAKIEFGTRLDAILFHGIVPPGRRSPAARSGVLYSSQVDFVAEDLTALRASVGSATVTSIQSGFSRKTERAAPVSKTGAAPVLVEVAGFEPASEELQRNGSTCLADRFSFAAAHAHRQA